ncbi:MAG: polyprenyl diphosphate synthase [Mycoplasma sp.]
MNNSLNHIAFIMDGNGRWAKSHNLERVQGHQKGSKQISKIIDACIKNDIKHISFFAFSTENWKRPNSEISSIIKLLKSNLSIDKAEWFNERKIKLNVLGFENKFTKQLSKTVNEIVKSTKNNNDYVVNIFFNYGSMQEIVEACNKAVDSGKHVTIKSFEKLLLTRDQPSVDLLIRTSGENRISNFLLWQIAYAEIIFEDSYWPDYGEEQLDKNILEYNKRTRRYGGI